ncbi:MAG: thiamine-monophosphate kinase (thiL) [Candidatus Bathyarchaeota archaeon B26-2]|nr:MAG: thiamine-monophosphate kinase (thiL) [Candidatus Bathyarchaeota archaeon B26-2]
MKRTIGEMGERRVIETILRSLDPMPGIPVPFGDDASAVKIDGGRLAVIKTDMLVGRTDVPPGMSLKEAARKAVIMNVSDLAAKGVKPTAIIVALGLPRSLTEEDVEQLAAGLNMGAREYDTYIIGGDTNEASDLVISCSALGFCEKGRFIERRGAKPGDILAVTGSFGRTACGLKILLEGFEAPKEIRDILVKSVLMPEARLKEGLALASTGAVTSSIDSSDGLAWSLHELSMASEVGFVVERLPIAPEARRFAEIHKLDPYELCLYGGEEYELVVTVRPSLWDEAEKALESLGTPLRRIGVATRAEEVILKVGEQTRIIEGKGWEHFRT